MDSNRLILSCRTKDSSPECCSALIALSLFHDALSFSIYNCSSLGGFQKLPTAIRFPFAWWISQTSPGSEVALNVDPEWLLSAI